MHVGTRTFSRDEPRALYPGDIIEGPEAAAQVAAGNAEELKDKEAENEKQSLPSA